jgi:transposase
VFYTCCQDLVKACHTHFSAEKREGRLRPGLNRVKDRVTRALGIPRSTVTKLLKETNLPKPGDTVLRPRGKKLSLEEVARIRPAFFRLLQRKSHITVTKIRDELRNEPEGWNTSRSTLWRALNSIGFEFSNKKPGYHAAMRENEENIIMRDLYLTRLEDYIQDNRQIVYMDESWLNKNIQPNLIWHDNTLSTINNVTSGKGQRYIMIGAGTKDGWLPNSFRMWKGNNKNEDYHSEMNSDVMNDWLVKYCLPNMDPRGVLVLDRAPYHVAISEATKPPQSSWKREELARYILAHDTNNQYTENILLHAENNVIHNDGEGDEGGGVRRRRRGFLKPILLHIAREMAPDKVMRITETVNEWNAMHNSDIRTLLLPVAHPQLNPIELVWSWVKVEVAKRNTAHTMSALHAITVQRVNEITPDMWNKSCNKSLRTGREYMEVDDEVMESGDEDDEEEEMNEGGTENNEGGTDSDSSLNSRD